MKGSHPQDLVTGADFLDRKEELELFRKRLESGQNTLLVAPRRFGKSSLIQETFERVRSNATCLYVDLFPLTSEREAAEAIMAALFHATSTRAKRLLSWLTEHLMSVGVTVRHAPSGFEVEFSAHGRERDDLIAALKALESFAEKRDRPVFLALDEFQRLLDWKGASETIAAMRSVIQVQRRTTYVLSGSKKHVLLGLVDDPAQPFWQQLDVMELGGIPISDFAAYAQERFEEAGRELTDAALERVAHWCRDNPKRIQELLQALLMQNGELSPENVDRVAADQVRGQQHQLRSLLDQVKAVNQVRLLRGLARFDDEALAQIFGAAFVAKNRLGGPANVRTAYNALLDGGLLDDRHRFTDPYLKWHLAGLPTTP